MRDLPGNRYFLLVTLEKKGKASEHQYADRFLGPELFKWQSQNQTKQDSKDGQNLFHHRERNITVHLFVRRRWKIKEPIPPHLGR